MRNYIRTYSDEYMLDLPHAVIFQAFKDLFSRDIELAIEAETFLMNSGGIWQEYTDLDISKVYLLYIKGDYDDTVNTNSLYLDLHSNKREKNRELLNEELRIEELQV